MSFKKDDYSDIEPFLTAAEFSELSDYEKLRLKNMKMNYEMMIKVGKLSMFFVPLEKVQFYSHECSSGIQGYLFQCVFAIKTPSSNKNFTKTLHTAPKK